MNKTEKQHHSAKFETVAKMLSKISIFGGLSKLQVDTLMKLLQEVSYTENEIIFKEGNQPDHIYIVKSGSVKITLNNADSMMELVTFREGECFGETSVIGIVPHSANAIADEDTELIILPRQALFLLFETDTPLFSILILNIAREACRRLSKTDKILFHYISKESEKN